MRKYQLPVWGHVFAEDTNNSDTKLSIDERASKLKETDPELYSAVFGRGSTKGSKEVTAAKVAAAIDDNTANIRAALRTERVDRSLRKKAKAAGFIEPDDVVDLLSKNFDLNADLEVVDKDGEKVNIEDAVKELASKRPHLVTASPQKPGQNSVRPATVTTTNHGDKPTFKRSQLRDAAFYAANEAAILEAARAGRIIDDV